MLETTQLNSTVADRDIVCYKVVGLPMNSKDDAFIHVKSNVIGYDYKVGELNVPVDVRVDDRVYTDVDGSRFLIVKCGYHSYAKKSDIAAVSPEQNIRECIIPKGERYFTDFYGKQLVSSNIIITDKIIERQ